MKCPAVHIEVWLRVPREIRHLRSSDVVGDEAQDDHLRRVNFSQLLAAQHRLVETKSRDAAVDHPPAGESLQDGGPRIRIADVIAKDKGVPDGERQRSLNWGRRVPVAPRTVVSRADTESVDGIA